jgi:hypothetical protein
MSIIIRVAVIVLSAYAGSVLASTQYPELPDLSQASAIPPLLRIAR